MENDGTSTGDITGIGLKAAQRGGGGSRKPLVPVEAIDVELPKTAKGYLWASAHEGKGSRGKYAAQVAPDQNGPGPYENLPGYGKTRKLSGPSGTRLWVRFARVRGQSQSEWSVAVMVTIP